MIRKRRQRSKQIEISSLIDILFILLIFLMVSVRFSESYTYSEFNLPKSEAQIVGDSKNEIKISISKLSEFFLNGRPIEKMDLINYIAAEVKVEESPTVILEVDSESKFGDFFEITNALKEKSIENVQIATRR
ncbi:hypothetical protein EHQ58_04845 [Leptospira ognonensis]|uniref:Biopolymer transporter ExbD n=1 Tax=Leptospira ognonensis TaxID=2484945 RepID=A0A4R9K8W2_9LEPT|nr:biopolymer transporter ExbD [Leptospira ognonensis]TGL61936.1 hypothetical protein EHQ58_04845 [Leptospira ognonensis]